MDNSSNKEESRYELVHDLATVLDKSFGYKGSFAYSENRPDAPNPFLTITDIGPISLPLSELDAKRIITCATQAPFGLGMSTVIDKEVRDTWQIDPSLVNFQNPAWDSFLKSNIANISSGLGLPDGYDIRCKLHKLLLYETGSHFRPHQDTQKEDGMFATMVVVLPSQYTGGEIIVSHGSISKVIDVSASCMTGINVLSWYTDVKHEVKPIRSGYRLALSYNLMRYSLSGSEVMATADNASELSRLHEILERWRTGGYEQLPEQRMVALVLGHQYSESDLDMGQAALKGQDTHRVNQIRLVAETLGFEVWLAKYERHIVRELPDDYVEGEPVVPGEVTQDSRALGYLTDLRGNRIVNSFEGFNPKCLIMGEPHHMGDPDVEDVDPGWQGNEPGTLEHFYHRVALVIFHKEDMDRVMIIVRGVQYVFDKLQLSLNPDKPTPEDRKIFDLLLEYNTTDKSIWKSMAGFTLRWHDLDLWNRTIKRVVERCFHPLGPLKEEIFLAWHIFGFQQVQSSYKIIFDEADSAASQKIDFIHNVKARAACLDEKEVVEAWCENQIVSFVKFCKSDCRGDALVSIAEQDGMKFLKCFNGKYCPGKYFRQIVKTFMSKKENIYALPANQPGNSNGEDISQIFEDFLNICILGNMYSVDEGNGFDEMLSPSWLRNQKFHHILEVVELCITTNRVDQCATLFRVIWDAESKYPLNKLMHFDIPLILRLRTRLQELGASLLPPFASFARDVIWRYLARMLGSKTHNPRSSAHRDKPPCAEGCSTCTILREFMEQLYVPIRDFCVSRKRREHFVCALRWMDKGISFTEVTNGRYRVTKRWNLLFKYRWEYRLEQARDMLKSIGDDDFIEQLMGDQFEEFKKALEGKCSYNCTGPLPRQSGR
ncbi:hypothetical protein M378DRAFT_27894 [Amanita muscaria Koide BX008]|uniref:Prolyl 4-hydroxylase alpha subunit Fe(2+) 2OG dioxygenase domain-containing protein n=1 Tax=Amanita muscaria (strain Koide BX008) TaxID=946122 RepID=A0A0C2WLP1_AMAMK|nr:hypothetical protein M378DRAFT_27894 [Amanita muscaria Koide BX008]